MIENTRAMISYTRTLKFKLIIGIPILILFAFIWSFQNNLIQNHHKRDISTLSKKDFEAFQDLGLKILKHNDQIDKKSKLLSKVQKSPNDVIAITNNENDLKQEIFILKEERLALISLRHDIKLRAGYASWSQNFAKWLQDQWDIGIYSHYL